MFVFFPIISVFIIFLMLSQRLNITYLRTVHKPARIIMHCGSRGP